MNARLCLVIAALLGFTAVTLGAFAAHGLKDSGFLEKKYADIPAKTVAGLVVPASFKYFEDFHTAVEYQMSHALALAITGLLLSRQRTKALSVAAYCFVGGIVLFSGSLYVLVLGGPRFLGIPWGAITPIGGVLFLAGWLSLAVGVPKNSGT